VIRHLASCRAGATRAEMHRRMGIDDCKTAWRACDRGRRRSAAVGTFDDVLSRYCRSPIALIRASERASSIADPLAAVMVRSWSARCSRYGFASGFPP